MKHLAVNQCHPFHRNPSSHFYEDYFLNCIPHPPPSPADKGSRGEPSEKPHRTSGDQRRDTRTRIRTSVTLGATVPLRRRRPEPPTPASHPHLPASATTFPAPLGSAEEGPAATPPPPARTTPPDPAVPPPRSLPPWGDTPVPGTDDRARRFLSPARRLLPHRDPPSSLRPATACPVRTASLPAPFPPRPAAALGSLRPAAGGTGRAQVREVAERGAGGGGPPAVPTAAAGKPAGRPPPHPLGHTAPARGAPREGAAFPPARPVLSRPAAAESLTRGRTRG